MSSSSSKRPLSGSPPRGRYGSVITRSGDARSAAKRCRCWSELPNKLQKRVRRESSGRCPALGHAHAAVQLHPWRHEGALANGALAAETARERVPRRDARHARPPSQQERLPRRRQTCRPPVLDTWKLAIGNRTACACWRLAVLRSRRPWRRVRLRKPHDAQINQLLSNAMLSPLTPSNASGRADLVQHQIATRWRRMAHSPPPAASRWARSGTVCPDARPPPPVLATTTKPSPRGAQHAALATDSSQPRPCRGTRGHIAGSGGHRPRRAPCEYCWPTRARAPAACCAGLPARVAPARRAPCWQDRARPPAQPPTPRRPDHSTTRQAAMPLGRPSQASRIAESLPVLALMPDADATIGLWHRNHTRHADTLRRSRSIVCSSESSKFMVFLYPLGVPARASWQYILRTHRCRRNRAAREKQ